MIQHCRSVLCAITVVTFILFASGLRADDLADQTIADAEAKLHSDMLKNLRFSLSVHVVDGKEIGVTDDELKNRVEAALRKAGIKFEPHGELGLPNLDVSIQIS